MWTIQLLNSMKWCVQEVQWILYWWYLLGVDTFFASAMNKISNNDTLKIHQILFLFFAWVFCSKRERLPHVETTPLLIKYTKHWTLIGAYGCDEGSFACHACCNAGHLRELKTSGLSPSVWKCMFKDLDLPLPLFSHPTFCGI